MSTAAAINNSATPQALQKYIPAHLQDPRQHRYYENPRVLSELEVLGMDVVVKNYATEPAAAPTPIIEINCEGALLNAPTARELARVMLELADAADSLAKQGATA